MMYSKAIVHTHVFVPKTELKTGLREAKLRLTVCSKYEDKSAVALYKETPTYFGMPRYYFSDVQSIATEVINRESLGSPIEFGIKENESHPRWGQQQRAVLKWHNVIEKGGTGALLIAPTGWGKTVCLLKLIREVGVTTLVIVPKTDLVSQWRDRILLHTTLNKSEVGIIQQDRCEFKGKKIVIGMMHSLAFRKKKYPKEMYNYFGCVVHDECHKVGAEQLGKTSCLFPARYRLGASATPKRRDGMNDILRYQIAQFVIGQTQDDMPKPRVIVYKYWQSSGGIWKKGSRLQRQGQLISRLATNLDRTIAVADYTQRVYHSGRTCIVFSDRLAQLDNVRDLLANRFRVPAGVIGKYVGGATEQQRINMANRCEILLATYGAMDLGTDIPRMSSIVLGTPRGSIKQVVGRIRRILEGKARPVVIDIVDTQYQECKTMYYSRRKEYKEMGSDFVTMEHSHAN